MFSLFVTENLVPQCYSPWNARIPTFHVIVSTWVGARWSSSFPGWRRVARRLYADGRSAVVGDRQEPGGRRPPLSLIAIIYLRRRRPSQTLLRRRVSSGNDYQRVTLLLARRDLSAHEPPQQPPPLGRITHVTACRSAWTSCTHLFTNIFHLL